MRCPCKALPCCLSPHHHAICTRREHVPSCCQHKTSCMPHAVRPWRGFPGVHCSLNHDIINRLTQLPICHTALQHTDHLHANQHSCLYQNCVHHCPSTYTCSVQCCHPYTGHSRTSIQVLSALCVVCGNPSWADEQSTPSCLTHMPQPAADAALTMPWHAWAHYSILTPRKSMAYSTPRRQT
jgi:hypothetical protein